MTETNIKHLYSCIWRLHVDDDERVMLVSCVPCGHDEHREVNEKTAYVNAGYIPNILMSLFLIRAKGKLVINK